jgi:hypothetical protein
LNRRLVSKTSTVATKKRRIRLLFPSLSRWSRFLTWFMTPLMYWLQGNYSERPQETHKWNYLSINLGEHFWITEKYPPVTIKGDPNARRVKYWRKLIPVFHMPRFGGWRKFVVLHPRQLHVPEGQEWYIGWRSCRDAGISMIPLHTPVRMLIGRKDVEFFALNAKHEPVELLTRGFGHVGKAGNFGKYPLR